MVHTCTYINPLTPNDHYSGPTAPLTSKCCIIYIYLKNIGTEYFEHCIYSPFFSLQNAVCFIILTYLVSVSFTFYIQDVLKFCASSWLITEINLIHLFLPSTSSSVKSRDCQVAFPYTRAIAQITLSTFKLSFVKRIWFLSLFIKWDIPCSI